jgi:hypothetical protein
MKDMVRKAGDPNDHEVLPWAASNVTYGLIRTVPGGDKWYTMISWFINIRVGSAHPGFITHMKGWPRTATTNISKRWHNITRIWCGPVDTN